MNPNTSRSEGQCPVCRGAIAGDLPRGPCPHCALRGALAVNPESAIGISQTLSASFAGNRFGDYELIEEIAHGGMGVVWKARQVSLNRLVALKMILAGRFAQPAEVQRFRIGAEAAARLRHPHIVPIFATGEVEGQPYFSMEYVPGRTLADLVSGGKPLPPRTAARYLESVTRAIHHAHGQGVLHRDLKPSNILIDTDDEPRVTDFGLARRFDEQDSGLTATGHVLGSPSYSPPEQLGGKRGETGVTSDIYSLGATLYHLMTGRPPFAAGRISDTIQQVLTSEPVAPRRLDPSLPTDLETICLKCLSKEPSRRYATAEELADELSRYLRDEPIRARPVGTMGRALRWCRRKPVLATLSAATSLLLLTVAIGSPIAAYRIRGERRIAEGRLYAAQMKLVHDQLRAGKIGGAQQLLRAQPAEFRGFDWRHLAHLGRASESPNELLATNTSGFTAVDWSPSQHTIALGTGDGHIEIYDASGRKLIKRWQAHSGLLGDLAFHPGHENWLVSVSGDDGLLKLWDVAQQRAMLETNGPKGLFCHVTFSPDGNFLASGASDGVSLNIWEVKPPHLILKTNLNFTFPLEAAFAADSRTLALCNARSKANRVGLYSLVDGRISSLPEVHADLVYSATFSLDGNLLATGGADEQVVVWDVKARSAIYTNRTDLVNVMSLVFSPDGKRLFAGGWDQNIAAWNYEAGNVPITLRGHAAAVNALAASKDGTFLVSASRDGTARLWDLREGSAFDAPTVRDGSATLIPAGENHSSVLPTIYSVAVSSSQHVVAVGTASELILFDLTARKRLSSVAWKTLLDTESTQFCALAFAPDHKTLVVGTSDGRVVFCDATTLERRSLSPQIHQSRITKIAFALEGSALITGSAFGGGLAVSDAKTGLLLTNFPAIQGSFPLQPCDVSRDGRMLAMGTPEQFVVVRDLVSGQVVARSQRKVRFLHAVTFSPDGKTIAYSDELGGVCVWDLTGRRPLQTLTGHLGPALDLAFSGDGRTLASASMDHTIKLWSSTLEQEVATLTGHAGWVWCIAFAENGRTLISGGRDGSLKAWNAVSPEKSQPR